MQDTDGIEMLDKVRSHTADAEEARTGPHVPCTYVVTGNRVADRGCGMFIARDMDDTDVSYVACTNEYEYEHNGRMEARQATQTNGTHSARARRRTLGSQCRGHWLHPADPAKAGAEVLRCPGAGGGRLPAWRTERACGPLTAGHEKGDTGMKGWAEPEHLHAQPGSQTAWVGEVA